MGNITWHKGGIYSKTLKRRINNKPLEVFYGQVWISSEKKLRHFRLGTTPRQAGREMRRILGNPEAALREREEKKCGTFLALVDKFMSNRSDETDYYPETAKPLLDYFGNDLVSSITPIRIDSYVKVRSDIRKRSKGRETERRVSDSTIRRELGVLQKILKWARARNYTKANPLADYEKPRLPPSKAKGDIAVVYPEQEAVLERVAPGWFWDILEWAMYSGMRRGEIQKLRHPDIDRHTGIISTGSKGKNRTIPMREVSGRLEAILKRVPRRTHSNYVFSKRDGTPYNNDELNEELDRVERAAAIPKVKGSMWNRYRHTFGTRLSAAGETMATISSWMGNTVAVCEKHYLGHSPRHKHAGPAALDRPSTVTTAPTTASTDHGAS